MKANAWTGRQMDITFRNIQKVKISLYTLTVEGFVMERLLIKLSNLATIDLLRKWDLVKIGPDTFRL